MFSHMFSVVDHVYTWSTAENVWKHLWTMQYLTTHSKYAVCFVVLWLNIEQFYPHSSGLLYWHCPGPLLSNCLGTSGATLKDMGKMSCKSAENNNTTTTKEIMTNLCGIFYRIYSTPQDLQRFTPRMGTPCLCLVGRLRMAFWPYFLQGWKRGAKFYIFVPNHEKWEANSTFSSQIMKNGCL